MDIFKENFYNFFKIFPKMLLRVFISVEGVKGGGPKTALSPTFSCNAKNQYL